jgi:hypothetical protein
VLLTQIFTLFRIGITKLTLATTISVHGVTEIQALIVAAGFPVGTAIIISAAEKAKPAAITEVAVAIFWTVVITATDQVPALVGIGVAELPFATTGGVIHATAVLASTVYGITEPGEVIAAVSIVTTVHATGIATTVGSGLEGDATISLTLCL